MPSRATVFPPALVLGLIAASCGGPAPDEGVEPAEFEQRIGAVFHRGEVLCLLLRNDTVAADEPVWILADEGGTFTHGTGNVVGEREQCAAAAEPGYSGYEVAGELTTGALGFGLLGATGPVLGDSTGYRVDIDGDGEPESFRTCPSSEAVHMTVWTGEPLTGTRRWHHYHYLGYDVEPACDPRDYEGTGP
ncbi:MAG: hypothetical protein KY466_05410 [Gemmatimonadetes bacterium]|nr:hypothetical protein [Gemmatimonadota bacterium]